MTRPVWVFSSLFGRPRACFERYSYLWTPNPKRKLSMPYGLVQCLCPTAYPRLSCGLYEAFLWYYVYGVVYVLVLGFDGMCHVLWYRWDFLCRKGRGDLW